jgi:hypothetical protein
MSPFLRNLAVTVLVATAAGAAGGWMGAERAQGGLLNTQPLRQTVDAVVAGDLNLTADQKSQVEAIQDRFDHERRGLRNRIAVGNLQLADALMEDMAYGRQAQLAVQTVQTGLGDLQKATVLYVLEVRDILTNDQQRIYDRKVREALTAAQP